MANRYNPNGPVFVSDPHQPQPPYGAAQVVIPGPAGPHHLQQQQQGAYLQAQQFSPMQLSPIDNDSINPDSQLEPHFAEDEETKKKMQRLSCFIAVFSIIILGFCVFFAFYFGISNDVCDHFDPWIYWCFITPGLAMMFFMYIGIFKCTRFCCCECWKCCGNDDNSKCATSCKICYEGLCGNPIFYGIGYIGWGIFNIYEVLDRCSDESTLFRYGYIGNVLLVGITIILFCCYYYYRTRRHWKKHRNKKIAQNYQEQQLKLKQNSDPNNPNGNIPYNPNNPNMNNPNNPNNNNNGIAMQAMQPVRGGGAVPIAMGIVQPNAPHHLANQSLPYEVEFDEGGEGGGEGGGRAGNNRQGMVGQSIPRNGIGVPSMSMNSSLPAVAFGGMGSVMAGVMAQHGSMQNFHNHNNNNQNNLANMNRSQRSRSDVLAGANQNARNNQINNNHNRNESVSISISISDPRAAGLAAGGGQRPSALSDPHGRAGQQNNNNNNNNNGAHVRQVSFPKQFLGFARRASSGILQVMADKEEECCICLGDFTADDDIATLQCFHYFHKKCIVDWLQNEKPECPVCNTSATIAGNAGS